MTEVAEQFTEERAGGDFTRITHWIDTATAPP